MASITKADGEKLEISFAVTKARIDKVEKWNDLSFSTTTTTSGGGGYVSHGSGYVSPVVTKTTTSASTKRHTRIYYTADNGSGELTVYDNDLPLLDGALIDISWYLCNGFHAKVAGILDNRTNTWYVLNSPQDYFLNWIGLSWIDFRVIIKYSIIMVSVICVGCILSYVLGDILILICLYLWLYSYGREVTLFVFKSKKYIHKSELDRSSIELRNGFLGSLGIHG
jgi:hypothetical protein